MAIDTEGGRERGNKAEGRRENYRVIEFRVSVTHEIQSCQCFVQHQ